MSDWNDLMHSLSDAYQEVQEKWTPKGWQEEKPQASTSKSKANNQKYKDKASEWKRRTGGSDYTAFRAGGGDPKRNSVGTMGKARIQQTEKKGRESIKAKSGPGFTGQRGPAAPTGSKSTPNLLDTFAKSGSKDAKSIQSKLSKGGSGGGASRPSGGGASRPAGGGGSSSGGSSSAAGGGSSKSSINAKYDQLRKSGDTAGAKAYGMAQHKKLFNKGGSSSGGGSTSSGASAIGRASAPKPSVSSGASSIGKAAGGGSSSGPGFKSAALNKAMSNIPKFKAENFDYLIGYLMDEGYANNEVSAEIILNHMSDEWLQSFISE